MEACSSFFLPRLVGYSRATHLATLGSVQSADSKLLDGLFSEIVPAADVVPRAIELASDYAENTSLVSTCLIRQLMYRNPGTPEKAHLLESRVFYETLSSPYETFLGLEGTANHSIGTKQRVYRRSLKSALRSLPALLIPAALSHTHGGHPKILDTGPNL